MKGKRKFCALLVSCAMLFSLLPTTAFAVDEDDTAEAGQETEVQAADIEIAEDGTATIVVEEEDETGQPEEAVPEEVEETTETAEVEAEPEEHVYTASSGSVKVKVTAPAGALPEDAELSVERYAEDSDEYKEAADAIGYEEEDGGMAALDISFISDGKEVEPSEAVKVSIDVSQILPSDADASTIEVQHLEEGRGGQTRAEVVANDSKETEGTIDAKKATAEFEVNSFSNFTITWAGNAAGGNSTEVTVYVYDINGLGIYDSDEQETYTWDSGEHTIASLLTDHVSGKISDSYTYAYATVGYLTTSAMGGTVTTIGSADDPVVSVSWNGTNYTITLSSGTTRTVASSNADEFYINLYYSTPAVSISVINADTTNHTVSLTAASEYFQDSDITYTWEIADGSDYATISGSGADATITWADGDQAGNTVTVRVTATTESGESAIATYELTYGMQQVTYTVYYNNGRTLASGADVALLDENGNVVSNGTAGTNGQVTLWVVPGTTYTLEATYTTSGTHYTYEDTEYVYVGDGTDNTTINLETSTANLYEHVDVKLSIAEEDAGYSDILSNVDYVKIYDEAGVLIYQSAELVHNEGTNDYNVLFADADGNEGTNPHSITFYDSYSIEIAYEVSYTYTDSEGNSREYTESYVATIDKNSTYMDGEYYSYYGTNAYQLYNAMYGTTYTEAQFLTAVENQTLDNYNEHGIDISNQTYFYVAANLCDSVGMTQAGLDLALGVNSLRRYSSTTWNFDIQKTLKNSGADAGAFSFGLYSATVDDSEWSINVSDTTDNSLEFTLSNGTMILPDGSTESVANIAGFFAFNYDSTMVGETQTYYFVLVENKGDDPFITYDPTVYGIKVEVTLNSSTDMTDVTIEETAYILNETTSSDADYRTFTLGDEFDGSVDDDGYTIFPFGNTYSEYTDITVEKVWVDNDNAYETRPGSITVTITGSDGNTYTLTLSDANDWTDTIADLPIYADDGSIITYEVTETEIENYEGDVVDNEDGTYTITNTLTGETEISVEKEWLDNDNAYETRPDSVTVTITGSDGSTYTLTLSDDNDWSDTLSGLPLYDSTGTEITYTVTEAEIEDYDGDVVDNGDGTYSITNTLTGETEISVEKEWVDNDNAYETRPESITVTVTGSDGNTYTLTLNDGNNWSDTLSELPKYDSTGTEITYTVTEAEIENYDGDVVDNGDGTYTITNTLTGETEISVEKKWVDNDDENGNRPESITVTITGSDGSTYTLTLDDNNDWSDTKSELPLYDTTGTEITYEVTEEKVTGYDGDVVDNGDGTYTITNTLQTTDISVIKVWNDDENRDGTRTDSVQIQLKAGEDNVGEAVTLDENDSWTYTWEGLPVYANGEEITYSIEEVEIPDGYTASYSSETDEDGNLTFTMVNTHEDALTQITVNKVWQDAENENGTRPDDVTVQLMANGEACGDAVKLDESNGWSYTWENLYSFEDGKFIEYTVEETAVEGYATDIGELTPEYDDNNLTGYTISVTNTRTGETEISVEKQWAGDSNNKYDTRPESITVTVTGSDENTYTLTLSDENNWSDALSGLPLYDSTGAEIEYKVTEEDVTGYDGEVVDNEDGTFTITNTVQTTKVNGSKTWSGDSAGDRPDSITIYLYADGKLTGDSITVTADDNWEWSFTDIPIYNADGEEIVYTVQEGEIEGYIPTYDGMNVTNALPEIHKYVSDPSFGESTDDDLKDDEAENHNTLEYKLEADHIGGAHDLVLHDLLDDQLDIDTLVIKEVILYADENDTGRTLEEGTDYTITKGECTADCGLEDCTFEIHVIDEDVEDLTSDAYIIVVYDIDLNEDVEDFNDDFVDEIINHVGLSFFANFATPDETDTYSYGFDLYKYATDTEEPLEGAEFILSKDGSEGTVYAQFDITDNIYLLTDWGSREDATVIVTASDGNAVIEGLHDGTFILSETKAPDGYTYTKQDTTIVIFVEDDYSHPTITVDGEEVTDETARIANAPGGEEQIPEKAVSIDGDDAFFDGDKDVSIGDTLTYEIRYYNNYGYAVTVTITDCIDIGLDFVEASDGGIYDEDTRTVTWTIENAPAYAWGSVTLTVTVNAAALTEGEIENTASVKIDGSDEQDTNEVENPVPTTRDISGSKEWKDDNDKADARPDSITVRLYQNGDPYKTETVTAADGWAWSWTDLPKYDEDGEAYIYTITEDKVEYYDTEYYEGNFNITNTFVGEEGAENPPTSGPTQGGDHQPKTGDTGSLGTWLALLIAAMACMLVGFRMRKRS